MNDLLQWLAISALGIATLIQSYLYYCEWRMWREHMEREHYMEIEE